MREDIERILKEDLPKSIYAVALKVFLDMELERLNDLSTIKGDVIEKGRITEGRQHAQRIIKNLMRLLQINKIESPPKAGDEYR